MTRISSAGPACVEYHAMRGTYGRVSYFIAKAPLRDVAENLALLPQESLAFTERINRIINVERIDNELVPYLRTDELRFFNSLVCVLMPDPIYEGHFWEFEEYVADNGERLGGLGKLRVAKNVGRVVLDGQHRYEALRKYWQYLNAHPLLPAETIEVPLTFVVIDDMGRAGSHAEDVRGKTIKSARNLFAVLNRTARPVDAATLLLIDDTDITNTMARRLLEDGCIKEEVVKWAGGQNLQPDDPYFTSLHVLRDIVRYYLRDVRGKWDKHYGTNKQRAAALERFYDASPMHGVPTRNAVSSIVKATRPLDDWEVVLHDAGVSLVKQPAETPLTKDQRELLEKARSENLAFTVAGQRALWQAIIDGFEACSPRDEAALSKITGKANALLGLGLFGRGHANGPFVDLLYDRRGRMIWTDEAVDCARKVLAIALGAKFDRRVVLQEYKSFTDSESDHLQEFWRHATEKGLWQQES